MPDRTELEKTRDALEASPHAEIVEGESSAWLLTGTAGKVAESVRGTEGATGIPGGPPARAGFVDRDTTPDDLNRPYPTYQGQQGMTVAERMSDNDRRVAKLRGKLPPVPPSPDS